MKNNDRKEFVKKCIDSPEKASSEIIILLAKMTNSKKTSERVNAISQLLHLSQSTIWRDYVE